MTDLVIPNTFVSGTTIVAADVNANFTAVSSIVNTGVPKLQDGAVDTSGRIANGVVTHAKMDAKTLGQQVSGGYAKITADASGGPVLNITITGDGVTPVKLAYSGQSALASGVIGVGTMGLYVNDAAALGGTQYVAVLDGDAGGGYTNLNFETVIPAFSGTKTFYLYFYCVPSTGKLTATAGVPGQFRATWAPGYST